MLRPVPEFIAAVMPTTRSSRSHSRTSASPKTCVYCGGAGLAGCATLLADALAPAGTASTIDLGLAAFHFALQVGARVPKLRAQADAVEVARQRAHVGRDGHAVVVEHDRDGGAQAARLSDRLEGHAAGHAAVADHRHDLALGAGAHVAHA